MNLAIKDISYNIGRFVLTAVGIGMLLMVVMGMGGIYRGVVEDATLLIDRLVNRVDACLTSEFNNPRCSRMQPVNQASFQPSLVHLSVQWSLNEAEEQLKAVL